MYINIIIRVTPESCQQVEAGAAQGSCRGSKLMEVFHLKSGLKAVQNNPTPIASAPLTNDSPLFILSCPILHRL